MKSIRSTGEKVDRLARAYMALHDCDYQQAFHAVLEGDAELKRAYTGYEHPAVNYAEAMRLVLDRNPALKKRYAES